MKRLKLYTYIAALHAALLCILLAASPAGSGSMTLLGAGKVAASTPSLSIDGTATGNSGGTSTTATLTTTKTNNRIVVMVLTNADSVTSITDTAGLTWTLRTTNGAAPASQNDLEEWSAFSSGILTSDVITVNVSSAQFTTVAAFAINGSSGFDLVSAASCTACSGALTVPTTSHANTVIYAGYRFNGTASPTAGSGWSTVLGANFMLVEYQIVSTIQTGTVATITTGNADENGGIADAIF